MPNLSFAGVLVIALIAVAVPVVLSLVPRLPVPGAVLMVLAGILAGPSVLGWVHVNARCSRTATCTERRPGSWSWPPPRWPR